VDSFGRRVAARLTEKNFAHDDFSTVMLADGKYFNLGRAAALPYHIQIK
jgi:hypothetical protein